MTPLLDRRGFVGLAFAAITIRVANAAAETPWARGRGAKMRLIAGGPVGDLNENDGGEVWLAGVEIALEPGYKTYWRNAGEGGIPPLFDWSGSSNLASAQVRWPQPARFEGGGACSIGYVADVIFPVAIRPVDPARPITLALALDYAACRELCVPERGAARLTLDQVSRPNLARLRAALALVPRRLSPGEVWPGTTAQARIEGSAAVIDWPAARGAPGDAFLEGPDFWLFGAPDIAAKADGSALRFPILDRPRAATTAPVPLTLTVVGLSGGYETTPTLDFGTAAR